MADNLTLFMWNDPTHFTRVPLIRTGIAWETDKDIKFRNPRDKPLKEAFKNHSKPKAWIKNIWELDLEDENNNGFQNEDFIVWMRTAALPTFRKLYRRVNHSEMYFKQGLKDANYTLRVEYSKYYFTLIKLLSFHLIFRI